MPYWIDEEYDNFERMLKNKHETIVWSCKNHHRKLNSILNDCKVYQDIVNDTINLDDIEANKKFMSDLDKLKNTLKDFQDYFTKELESNKIFVVASKELKRLRKKMVEIFRFIKVCQITLNQAITYPEKCKSSLK